MPSRSLYLCKDTNSANYKDNYTNDYNDNSWSNGFGIKKLAIGWITSLRLLVGVDGFEPPTLCL